MKWIKRFLALALIAFVVIQFVRPTKNQDVGYTSLESFINDTKPTPAVAATLESACYDCHTNHTDYPWYAEVAPVSFWLRDHIVDGKKHLNFSEWSKYSVKRKDHKLEELIEMVEDKEMPLDSYTWTHGEARLSDEQIQAMLTWAKLARTQYSAALQAQ